jgi:predicted GTPase
VKRSPSIRIPRLALLVVALLLPAASLVPLGTLWLWQHGYVLYWAIGALLAVAAVYGLERRLLAPLARAAPARDAADAGARHDEAWTPRQIEAWGDVTRFAESVPAERLASRDAALGLALETVELVATRLHPERREPLLQFTVPEALAVIERASANLRGFLVTSFPLGDRITVAQLMWLYRWRHALRLAEKGYDLWRIVRLLNPVTAATLEVRERLSRQLYEAGREHLARRLASAFVKEVGRAAIDLYGGNLRITTDELRSHVTADSRKDLATAAVHQAEPLRILLAGQTGAGKSSLLNALAGALQAAVDTLPATGGFTAHRLTHEGMPAALVIDSPGLSGKDGFRELVAAAHDCDMLLWVISAVRAARDIDVRALAAIRKQFAAERDRHRPPMLLILTHIDQLRPFTEWEPPYEVVAGTRAKAVAIRDAMDAAGRDLGFAAGEIIPVRVDAAIAPYNIDALWAKLIELLPDSQRARLLRTLGDLKRSSGWARVWSQAANAGRVVRDAFLPRDAEP